MKSLQDPVTALKGVGKKKAEQLATLGIETIEDLLTHYPARYDDFAPTNLEQAKDKQKVTLHGTVITAPVIQGLGPKRSRLSFQMQSGEQVVPVTFFNQPYLKNQVLLNADVTVLGTWNQPRQQVSGSKLITTAPGEDPLQAIYPANKHIRQATIKQLIATAYNQYRDVMATLLPLTIRQRYQLLDRPTMFAWLHFPKDGDQARAARRTAAYEEFFLFQLRLQLLRLTRRKGSGVAIEYDNQELRDFIQTIPFELTAAQKRVVNEICRDLRSPFQMNRLLQGDVGSGKTIVAAIAIYATILTGYQAALMAPTEILAEQHAKKLAQIFAGTPVKPALLTGSLTAKQHRELTAQIQAGQVNLIVGTHALIQDQVEYANLGLVVIDEQHRFGVDQRKLLRQKGQGPNVLSMTATPIPRTLSITTFGEMDVSMIDQLPAGRKPIKTTWLKADEDERALNFLRTQLAAGAQAYVVSPLIAESENLDVQNATALADYFREELAPDYQVGLLHGQMTNAEKDQAMADFVKQKTQILVATTVIEVGVDNPNATVMMIYDADRFGLAQLHQLRGRVGRGDRQSYCLLLASPKSDEGQQRMETMVETTDGFVVAQRDLELRGGGDLLGKKQSGMPDFKIGDPVGDVKMMQYARQDALDLLETPNWDDKDENQPLVWYLAQRNLRTHFD